MKSRLTIAALILTAAMFARGELVATLRVDVQGTATNASAISGGALAQVGDIAGALDAAVLLAAQQASGATGEVIRAYADAAFLPLLGTAVHALKANGLVSGADEGVEIRFVGDTLTLFTVTEQHDTNTVVIASASEDYNGPAVGTEFMYNAGASDPNQTVWTFETWDVLNEIGFDWALISLNYEWYLVSDNPLPQTLDAVEETDATGTVTIDWLRWETTNTTALATWQQVTNAIAQAALAGSNYTDTVTAASTNAVVESLGELAYVDEPTEYGAFVRRRSGGESFDWFAIPNAGCTTIADAATLELSGATGSYYSHPTTWRTNTLSIAADASAYPYTLHFHGTNVVALSADMVLMGDLPDPVDGRVFGFSPYTNSTWRVIGVAP